MITRDNYEIWFLDFAEGKLDPSQQDLLFAFLKKNPDLKKELDAFENISFEKPVNKSDSNTNLKKNKSWLLEKYTTDELVFNFCENNFSQEELREWNDLVKVMPELVKQVEQEQKLVLKPNTQDVFVAKSAMKKENSVYAINESNYQAFFIEYAETKSLPLHAAINAFLKSNPALKAEFELTQKTILKADTSVVFEYKAELKKREKMVAFYVWRSIAVAACLFLAAIFFYPGDDTSGTKTLAETKDSSKLKNQSVPENKIDPNAIANKEETTNSNNNVALNNVKQVKNNNNKNSNEKHNHPHKNNTIQHVIENKNENVNFVEVPKNKKDQLPENNKDSIKQQNPVVNEKPAENYASNKSTIKKDENGVRPLEAVASVINKKYYEDVTPKEQTTSPFYAMKNVVKSVSGGNADIVKKEDSDYKETGFKIGDFKFSRKKNKNKVNVD